MYHCNMAFITYTDDIVKVCASMAEDYRKAARAVTLPAERKLMESIARQKVEQAEALAGVFREARQAAGGDAPSPPALNLGFFPPIPDSIELKSLLTLIVERESAFASLLDALGRGNPAEEARVSLLALADSSRKFASWAQDHIDLIGLF